MDNPTKAMRTAIAVILITFGLIWAARPAFAGSHVTVGCDEISAVWHQTAPELPGGYVGIDLNNDNSLDYTTTVWRSDTPTGLGFLPDYEVTSYRIFWFDANGQIVHTKGNGVAIRTVTDCVPDTTVPDTTVPETTVPDTTIVETTVPPTLPPTTVRPCTEWCPVPPTEITRVTITVPPVETVPVPKTDPPVEFLCPTGNVDACLPETGPAQVAFMVVVAFCLLVIGLTMYGMKR